MDGIMGYNSSSSNHRPAVALFNPVHKREHLQQQSPRSQGVWNSEFRLKLRVSSKTTHSRLGVSEGKTQSLNISENVGSGPPSPRVANADCLNMQLTAPESINVVFRHFVVINQGCNPFFHNKVRRHFSVFPFTSKRTSVIIKWPAIYFLSSIDYKKKCRVCSVLPCYWYPMYSKTQNLALICPASLTTSPIGTWHDDT